ncbi:MAG: hypothetical protein NT169_16720 [Chloroflexi bacterium]|nr:hypothetical protein [Chloroflexota bacterium]
MKRLLLVSLLLVMAAVLVLAAVRPSQALPEYSAQTGEPCATCHISPSGGGLRTPRGQGWIGSGRPGAVPVLADALALLGVRLKVNEQDFVATPGAVKAAEPLKVETNQTKQINTVLKNYEGN